MKQLGASLTWSPGSFKVSEADLVVVDMRNQCCGVNRAHTLLAPHLARFANLQGLDLFHNRLGPMGTICLAPHIAQLSCLLKLDLSANRMGAAGSEALDLSGLFNLQTLGLSSNGLTCVSMSALAPSSGLIELDLSRNNLGAGCLARCLARLSRLQILNLSSNGINDIMAESLPLSLRVFDASCNNFGDTAAVCLGARLALMTNLQELDMSFNQLHTAGLAPHLATLSSLQKVNLSFNPLGDAASRAIHTQLAGRPSLQVLCQSSTAGTGSSATRPSAGISANHRTSHKSAPGEELPHQMSGRRLQHALSVSIVAPLLSGVPASPAPSRNNSIVRRMNSNSNSARTAPGAAAATDARDKLSTQDMVDDICLFC